MFNSYQINTLGYDPALCVGCGMCETVCPHRVFRMDGRLAQVVRAQSCMECGACELNCPTGAISVDSGTGCATAMMLAAIRGRKAETCGCG